MSLLRRVTVLFAKEPAAARLGAMYGADGIDFTVASALQDSTAILIDSALALPYLNDLAASGIVQEGENSFRLGWVDLYALLDRPEHEAGLRTLGLPEFADLIPTLRADGGLADPDFRIGIEGWHLDGRALGAVTLCGPLARHGTNAWLLKPRSYALVRAIQACLADADRSAANNRRHWGAIRAAALAAQARMDQFLTFTIVLSPETLHIHLERNQVAETGVVEVQPWFAGAPESWLDEFDRFGEVPELYRLMDGERLVEVVVTPKVRRVLRAIKAMPGRRVAGAFAEKFLANPFAALGEDASEVIDEAQFERARRDAGIEFVRFTAHCAMQEDVVVHAGVLVQTLAADAPTSTIETFGSPAELEAFVRRVESKIKTGQELCEWRGHQLQLTGDVHEQLDNLRGVYKLWTAPRVHIKAADVLDLKRYAERVAGIGVQAAIVSPHIPKPDSDPWFPAISDAPLDVSMVSIPLDGGTTIELLIDKKVYQTLRSSVEAAERTGKSHVDVPGAEGLVSVERIRNVLEQLAQRFDKQGGDDRFIIDGKSRNERNDKKSPSERQELLIRLNVDQAEYREARASELKFDAATPPRLPATLQSCIELKDHQKVGVAWMQHLLGKAPCCRGAVLADDMGLGKTLQLLAVIAAELERDPGMDPVLVVAPVSLLENWKAEADKFFRPGALPLLMLYGEALAGLRASRTEIEATLLEKGFTRFLRDGWLESAKVVLTTYETLRDLEFSLAAVRWSIMICDEAQKIKNPAAMVTRSAKKQNVGFRIACTGTPVENSLADLWCLFDYVQPGLLGALNEFSTKYRRPIECKPRSGDVDAQGLEQIEALRALIEPQILRRLKVDVAKDLPRKIVVNEARQLRMSPFQRSLYGKAIEFYRLRNDPLTASPFKNQLGLLHYLRQVCTNPYEIGRNASGIRAGAAIESVAESRRKNPKLDWLLTTLQGIRSRAEKAIVFCEFREMQLMLAHCIKAVLGVSPDIINGDTTTSVKSADSRQKRIDAFQAKPGFGVIILSPVAVGFGVNIQAANHVIHFSRTWNPAKEDQATDRAFRIGQTRDVYVYCPVIGADEFVTFDVKLDQLLAYKRELSQDMLNGTGDVTPGDFDSIVAGEDDVFDERIGIDDADRLDPVAFEAMVASLWLKAGVFKYVRLTPASGDGGIDVVAKTGREGELVQAKLSRNEDTALGWDAIKELVGGQRGYELQYPGVRFGRVAVTNRRFNGAAARQAAINQVRLVERGELESLLDRHRVTREDLERFIRVPGQILS